ncbi:MAG: HAMP domain-containing sensor histidine kinase [Clostridia bacterium]|nr:HAMP domain-containing sensor histidine kinase [Clostridia bacterium]
MRNAIAILGTYLLGIAACVTLCLSVNGSTPILEYGSTLPDDIDDRQYILRGYSAGNGNGEYAFMFSAESASPALAVTVSDVGPFTLYFQDAPVFRYAPGDLYNRNITVNLGAVDGQCRIRFLFDSKKAEAKLLFGNLSVPKVLLGTLNSQARAQGFYQRVASMCVGLYLMLIFSCLTLYANRRQEKYLLSLAFVALASMAVMLVDSNAALFRISQENYAKIRSSLFICPVIFTAAIGFYLFYAFIPDSIKPFLTPKNLLLMTVFIATAQYFCPYNLNYAVRVLLMAPLLILFVRAGAKNASGVQLLAAGCGIADGARIVVYIVNTLGAAEAGETLIYLRVTQLGYLAYLILCMTVIFARFAAKFTEAEVLVETLDAKVEKRTAQLKKANTLLETTRRREHEMMTNVLHDLRTPIFHLQGCLDMLEAADSTQSETLSLMRERTDYLKSLAENLFLAARLEEGHIAFNRHEVNLSSICRYIADGARMSAHDKGVRLEADIPDTPPVISDGFRIRQVLENLMDNAVKYTPQGGQIRLCLGSEKDGVTIEVSNTGDGIKPEHLSRVFDRFYHGANSGSSGLGLYIAKTLMDRLGGTLEARSSEGLTVFTVRIVKPENNAQEAADEKGTAD